VNLFLPGTSPLRLFCELSHPFRRVIVPGQRRAHSTSCDAFWRGLTLNCLFLVDVSPFASPPSSLVLQASCFVAWILLPPFRVGVFRWGKHISRYPIPLGLALLHRSSTLRIATFLSFVLSRRPFCLPAAGRRNPGFWHLRTILHAGAQFFRVGVCRTPFSSFQKPARFHVECTLATFLPFGAQ